MSKKLSPLFLLQNYLESQSGGRGGVGGSSKAGSVRTGIDDSELGDASARGPGSFKGRKLSSHSGKSFDG